MSGKFLARASALSLAVLLAACGGGDDSTPLADTGNGSAGGDGTTATIDVGSMKLLASSPQIGTATSSSAQVTAIARNKNGVVMPDVPVTFSVNSDGSLQQLDSATDESGSAKAILTTPFNVKNRTITVTAQAGNQAGEVTILAKGTTINLSGPASIPLGNTATYNATLKDSAGNGIAGENITITNNGSNTIINNTGITSSSGASSVEFSLRAETGGLDTITVSAYEGESRVSASLDVAVASDNFNFKPLANPEIPLNTNQELSLSWSSNNEPINGSEVVFSTTRGSLSPANGTAVTSNGVATIGISASTAGPAVITAKNTRTGLTATSQVEFIATEPASIISQANISQLQPGEETQVTAAVRDAANNLVKNQTVNFRIVRDVSGGTLLSSSATTNSQGQASVIYRAGSAGTGSNGVEIEVSNNQGARPRTTLKLTVADSALRITLGTGNEIIEPDTTRYDKPWVVFVTDANGAPIGDATVELSLLSTDYGKGQYQRVDTDNDGTPDSWAAIRSVTCVAEDDANKNGIADPGEDTNNNGILDPSNNATFAPGNLRTAADGSANFSLLYPQSNCSWTDVELTATVKVSGSENKEKVTFTLPCSASDLNDIDVAPPGGVKSKYGIAAVCADPN